MDRILIVDDDVELCSLIAQFLKPEGFEIEAKHDGAQAVERALTGEHELIVLDVMLPGMNGFEVLRRVRAKSRLPVLMLTARGEDVDRIIGLEIGADDYLPKPFNPRELVARIRAILRRASPGTDQEPATPPRIKLVIGDVELDGGARLVRRDGKDVNLTTVEFDLLRTLMELAGRAVTREELTESVLGRGFSTLDRSIDTHVSNLRRKLGLNHHGAERIKTVRSVGYLYALPDAQ
ncbi:MAG TPA: response regulator transcription factor [Pyrinomonadaceae bacterium]|nr:response regulator transcription factor [Pyrinomonadaceae bacterium]